MQPCRLRPEAALRRTFYPSSACLDIAGGGNSQRFERGGELTRPGRDNPQHPPARYLNGISRGQGWKSRACSKPSVGLQNWASIRKIPRHPTFPRIVRGASRCRGWSNRMEEFLAPRLEAGLARKSGPKANRSSTPRCRHTGHLPKLTMRRSRRTAAERFGSTSRLTLAVPKLDGAISF
jgi:hypothetical protein